MKIFLAILIGLSFSIFGFAQNVVVIWTWVAAGCRDSSLSASSHITKSKNRNPFQIKASELTLRTDGSAAMTIEIEGHKRNETGTYTVENNQVAINDSTLPEDENPVLIMDINGEDLLLSYSTVDSATPEPLDDQERYDDENEQICGSNQTYVYVFSNVGS